MTEPSKKAPCAQEKPARVLPPSFRSPESSPRGTVRPSRMGRKRALVLVGLHVLVLVHLIHWWSKGVTASPLEPSEAMYTLKDGIVNCGAVLIVVSVLSTLVLGRWFCGWGCHVVALQDACAWLLKKIGIHPRPLRSRWLVLVPLLAGLYMFFWPRLMGLVNGIPAPSMKNGFEKTDFWETFPGFWVGTFTFLVCGFAIVYLLGAKGFCTYACPYGGLFGVADRLATGRIRVTDACKQCGHCTAVCTSNVIVNREVLEYGMVVDPGCMKCQDCISVCPENALYFGFGKPALFARAKRKLKKIATPQFSWREELSLLAIFGLTLATLRGLPQIQTDKKGEEIALDWAQPLYDGLIPLLFSLGLSAITAFVLVFAFRVVRRPSVDFLGLAMKKDGRLARSGWVFLVLSGLWFLLLADSVFVQYHAWQGLRLVQRDEAAKQAVWWQDPDKLAKIPAVDRERWRQGVEHLVTAGRFGLAPDARIPRERGWVALANGRLDDAAADLAEAAARKPNAGGYYDQAHVDLLRGQVTSEIEHLRKAIALRPRDIPSRNQLVDACVRSEDFKTAALEQRVVLDLLSKAAEEEKRPDIHAKLLEAVLQAHYFLVQLVPRSGDVEAAIAEFRVFLAAHPDVPEVHAMLGLTLQAVGRAAEAAPHLATAEKLAPGIVERLAGASPASQPVR